MVFMSFRGSSGYNIRCTKAKTEDNILFCFKAIADGRKEGVLTPDMVSSSAIEGRNNGGKGLVDLILFKRSMLTYFTGTVLPSKTTIDASIRAKICDVVFSHESLRSHVGYKNKATDQGWRAGWPASADALLSLIEDRALCIEASTFHV